MSEKCRIRKWISRGRAGLNLTGSWLSRHADEPFVILTGARLPADNNGSERDIRSLVAARSEHRTRPSPYRACIRRKR
jgi:hypothetical protein